MSEQPQLQRHLSNRHVQLIAIGGAIGTGLFMGSGRTISMAGPSVLLVYAIIGGVLFLIMRAMGELLLSNHSYGTFSDFIADINGPGAGFVVGWTYWLCWIVTATAEVIAVAGYFQYWWPDIPLWIPAVTMVLLIFVLNSLTVKAFGETEFWFSLIKIIAIVALIVMGIVMVATGFTSPDGTQARVDNLWTHVGPSGSGFFPNGLSGFLAGFQLAIFSFIGIELIGTTAAETKDPDVTLPKAINSIPVRILLFYVLALAAIMMVTPWDKVDPEISPFVNLFALVGMTSAASVVNFVVITSAASSCNSGVYSTSRMVYSLAKQGNAPKKFTALSNRNIPERSLILSCLILLSSIPILYFGGTIMEAFTAVTAIGSVLFLFVWFAIVVAYIAYRRRRPQDHARSHFKLPGGRFSAWFVIVFIAAMVVVLAQDPSTLRSMVLALVWLAGLGIVQLAIRRRPENQAKYLAHREKVEAELEAAQKWNAGIKAENQPTVQE